MIEIEKFDKKHLARKTDKYTDVSGIFYPGKNIWLCGK